MHARINTLVARVVGRLVASLGSRSLEPRSHPPVTTPVEPRVFAFDVYTFVTDDGQYAEMRASFEAAGFIPPSARFHQLRDRRHPDGSDPYALIASLASERDRRYVILVHQDVRLDQGAGAPELVRVLRELDAVDQHWVVAGNAGGTHDRGGARRLRDPWGGSTDTPLPLRVVSMDENFLVFNPAFTPRVSPELSGFHFYGTDVCLNAVLDGDSAYVVDFPVTHLSSGSRGPEYEEARARFVAAWNRRFFFAIVRAPTELFYLSRSRTLRRVLGSDRVRAWVRAWGRAQES